MQGEDSEKSVMAAFDSISAQIDRFDVVVIIRGGGAVADLSCFDSYAIAARIAHFELPVVTGIGHEKDDTIVDIVAHTKMKTPTAVAEFLIAGVRSFDEKILFMQSSIVLYAEKLLSESYVSLDLLTRRLSLLATHIAAAPKGQLDTLKKTLTVCVRQYFQLKGNRLSAAEQAIRLLDPVNVLKRGYSITRYAGKSLKDPALVSNGDIIKTELYKGSIRSIVDKPGRDDGKDQ
jgi:exodeoxyribonuclease VII large subunit